MELGVIMMDFGMAPTPSGTKAISCASDPFGQLQDHPELFMPFALARRTSATDNLAPRNVSRALHLERKVAKTEFAA